MSADPWCRYAVQVVHGVDGPELRDDCVPLTVVSHVAHLQDAIRIAEDGFIRSSLVWDTSLLNNTRAHVSWLSANDWYYGSIYGNIRFDYDWQRLVEGATLYWVEDMRGYSPSAFRILITRNNPPLDLQPYPITQPVGPIWLDETTGKWYWNGSYTSEFLIDKDLALADASGVAFVDHHPRVCSKDGSHCSQRGTPGWDAGAEFMALAAGRRLTSAIGLLDLSAPGWGTALRVILMNTTDSDGFDYPWPPAPPEQPYLALARSVLDAWGSGRTKQAKALMGLFPTPSVNLDAVCTVLHRTFAPDD